MAQYAVFTLAELALLAQATRVSRDLAGQYYALPCDWFENTSHRICSARDLRRGEVLGQGHLAQIRRVLRLAEHEPVLRCRRLCPHFRICLQDHNLLRRAREGCALDLETLLTWVLTHEYVHLVRFSRGQHPYRVCERRRLVEEGRVDEITAEIVGRLGHRRLRQAGGRWGSLRPGEDLHVDAPELLVDLPERGEDVGVEMSDGVGTPVAPLHHQARLLVGQGGLVGALGA